MTQQQLFPHSWWELVWTHWLIGLGYNILSFKFSCTGRKHADSRRIWIPVLVTEQDLALKDIRWLSFSFGYQGVPDLPETSLWPSSQRQA